MMQKIPIALVAGDDRAFAVGVQTKTAGEWQPLDLTGADLRAEIRTPFGQAVPLPVVGGVGRVVVVLHHAATENAAWRNASADVRLVSDSGVATLFALDIKLLPRITRVAAGEAAEIAETEAATVRLEEGGGLVELVPTDTETIVQLDDTLRIVYAAADDAEVKQRIEALELQAVAFDSAVRPRLAALELQTATFENAMQEVAGLSGEMAGVKAQVSTIGAINARLDEMAKSVSDGLFAQAGLDALRQQMASLQAAMADKAAAADIVRLAGQIAAAETGLADLRQAVADAAAAGVVADLAAQIAALQAQSAADKAALDALTQRVNDGAALAKVAADVAALSGRVDTALQAAGEIELLQSAVAALRDEMQKADDGVVKALAGRVAALEAQTATMPKFKAWQAGYIPRAYFVGAGGNNVLVTASFPQPFSERPLCFVLIDVDDTVARYQSVNNVTATGFQLTINYAASIRGVNYLAFLPA